MVTRLLRPGDPPTKISASGLNDAFAVARAWKEGRLGGVAGGAAANVPPLIIRNNTGSDIPVYGVVGLDDVEDKPDPATGNDGDTARFRRAVIFSAVSPTVEKHFDRFAVTQVPITSGGLGPAVNSGVTRALLKVSRTDTGGVNGLVDVDDTMFSRCSIREGAVDSLAAHPAGPCKIIWRGDKQDGSNRQWAVIQFDVVPKLWFRFKLQLPQFGTDQTSAPPFAVVHAKGTEQDARGVYQTGERPGFSESFKYFVNGPQAVAINEFGYGTFDDETFLKIEDNASEPALGAQFTDSGQNWHAGGTEVRDNAWEYLGTQLSEQGLNNRILVRRESLSSVKDVIFQLTEEMGVGDDYAEASVFRTVGSGRAPTANIQVFNWPSSSGTNLFTGNTGDYGYARWNGFSVVDGKDQFVIVMMECP